VPSLRLHHDSLTAPAVVAVECARGYKQPYQCPLCGQTHQHKTVHLRLDGNGDVLVTEEVWKDLKDVPDLPFTTNAVKRKPPKVILSLEDYKGPETEHLHRHEFKGRR
jgi:hypothetical protein